MRHVPKSPSIVSLREACEDDRAVHLVMDLCEGGELFDRIVAKGHYSERAAAAIMRTIVEVVQLCHRHGVIHRDLKPENFLFVDKKENSPLKAIDFGLSIFFEPGGSISLLYLSVYDEIASCLWLTVMIYLPNTYFWTLSSLLSSAKRLILFRNLSVLSCFINWNFHAPTRNLYSCTEFGIFKFPGYRIGVDRCRTSWHGKSIANRKNVQNVQATIRSYIIVY